MAKSMAALASQFLVPQLFFLLWNWGEMHAHLEPPLDLPASDAGVIAVVGKHECLIKRSTAFLNQGHGLLCGMGEVGIHAALPDVRRYGACHRQLRSAAVFWGRSPASNCPLRRRYRNIPRRVALCVRP